jgi:hypothetical protein
MANNGVQQLQSEAQSMQNKIDQIAMLVEEQPTGKPYYSGPGVMAGSKSVS